LIEGAVGLTVPGPVRLIEIMRKKEQGNHRADRQRDATEQRGVSA
jgi:hypothetical protein